ncbi:MAG: hypothetical protein LC745_09355 [Planctomycetia bacterium]|nr:hypothetical protein [Planctomycetia bacterium]
MTGANPSSYGTTPASPGDANSIAERFGKVRSLAGVRDSITPYSFRHLFISQLLQAGVDVFRVAKMSGNSVDVIESTYGRLRSEDFQAAVRRLEELPRG